MTEREKEIIGLIHREVKPALGCTEPIAVALAVAKAVEIMEERCPVCRIGDWRLCAACEVEVVVSGNILKNGMGVGIPGTGMVGLHIAAALGAVCGRSEYGLEVLEDLDERAIARAKALVEEKKIKVTLADTEHKLYVKAAVRVDSKCTESSAHNATAVIEDDHDNIVETYFDDKMLSDLHNEGAFKNEAGNGTDPTLTVKEIFEFADKTDFENIAFILDSRKLNLALSEEGLHGDYGLRVGKTIYCTRISSEMT